MSEAPTNQAPDDFDGDQPGAHAAHAWMPPKQPAWAFALNFFLPGAGLVYLGRPLWGLINFVTVVTLAAAIYGALPPDVFERCAPWIGIAFQVGSGLLAQWLAHAEQGVGREDRQTEADE
ncbi:MAG TPA: hypothetical protein VMV69_18645 [Pirellulales bacterium]|nr:hypothetical protein [Pirellulales bacterium]